MFKNVLLLSILLMSFNTQKVATFKENQLNHYRVFEAYRDKAESAFAKLNAVGVKHYECNILIRGFKFEEDLEVWAKNLDDSIYKLVTSYKFCKNIGQLGPKRKEGDKQIPEGVYSITQFNYASEYYLSLKVGYPNASDRVLSDPIAPGGMIYLHGGCNTIGCIPITDEWIKELYVFCVEARNSGQLDIPVHLFPARLTDENYSLLKRQYNDDALINFWKQLKIGYDLFEVNNRLPRTVISPLGEYFFFDH